MTPSRVSPSPPGEFPATKRSHHPMQKMTEAAAASRPSWVRPSWDTLEAFARSHVRDFIQQLLEDEVTELLGRAAGAGGRATRCPQRPWPAAPTRVDERHHHRASAARARSGGALCESAAAALSAPHAGGRRALAGALPPRPRPRGFRTRAAGAAGRGRAALGELAHAAEGDVAGAVRRVAAPRPVCPTVG